VATGDTTPSEFCVFTSGTVETVKGVFTFGPAEAAAVMAEYEAHGAEIMIDYDHAALGGSSADPALAGRAAGWANLELRDGDLYAVNVRWTPAASLALLAREWRYMSPAFQTDGDRIVALLNIAIVNLPATRRLEPLMAASLTSLSGAGMMDPKLIAEALDALVAGDDAKCAEILKGMIASAAGAEVAEDPAAEDPAVEPLASMDPAADKPEEIAAALNAVQSLSGKTSFVASVADVRTWHASHLALAAGRKALADREVVLEGAERRKLCVELVTLAGRAPANVWATSAAGAPPKGYLASMPIADLREYHADAVKAHAGKPAASRPPTTGADDLTDGERAKCFAAKIDPAKFAALKKARG
jgi:hypothetical protein